MNRPTNPQPSGATKAIRAAASAVVQLVSGATKPRDEAASAAVFGGTDAELSARLEAISTAMQPLRAGSDEHRRLDRQMTQLKGERERRRIGSAIKDAAAARAATEAELSSRGTALQDALAKARQAAEEAEAAHAQSLQRLAQVASAHRSKLALAESDAKVETTRIQQELEVFRAEFQTAENASDDAAATLAALNISRLQQQLSAANGISSGLEARLRALEDLVESTRVKAEQATQDLAQGEADVSRWELETKALVFDTAAAAYLMAWVDFSHHLRQSSVSGQVSPTVTAPRQLEAVNFCTASHIPMANQPGYQQAGQGLSGGRIDQLDVLYFEPDLSVFSGKAPAVQAADPDGQAAA